MYLLDTNHLTILQRGGTASKVLEERLEAVNPNEIATTIVNYEEQTRGWLAEANHTTQQQNNTKILRVYQQLEQHLQFFMGMPVIGFDTVAIEEFKRLSKIHRKISSMDLKIAAIALTQNATLLTQNLSDFNKIANLKLEDWSY
jgi:tRNA(fMet)-specific endonuclease VapC